MRLFRNFIPLGFSSLLLTALTAFGASQTVDYRTGVDEALRSFNRHDYAQAAAILEDGIQRARRDGSDDWEARMLSFLGSVYERQGRYEEAEQILNRSIDEWTRIDGEKSPGLVGALGNLGGLYYQAGRFANADQMLSRAVAIESASAARPDVLARLLTNLGNVYFREHKGTLAEQTARQALRDFALTSDPRPGSAIVCSLLAAIEFEAGRPAEAEPLLQQALAIWKSMPSQDSRLAEGIGNLAIFYSAEGESEKAEPLFEEAKELFESSRDINTFFMRSFLEAYAGFERKEGHRKEAKELAKEMDRLWADSAAHKLSRNIVDVNVLQAGR